MRTEAQIKREIMEKLQQAPKYVLFCSACGKYLCCATIFQKYIVHYNCRNLPVRYYNIPVKHYNPQIPKDLQ